MDTTLVTVTVLSMGMAATLSVIVWRMLRDERRRSDARVVALTAASRTGKALAPARPRPSGGVADLPLRETPMSRETPVMTGAMFAEPERSTPWWNRAAVMAAMALLGTSVLLLVMSSTRPRARAAAAPASPAAAVTAAQSAESGLELLSLHDARTAEALTITGMVRNPRDGALRSRVAVTAYAFDDKGAFLASGRALLDVTALAPGDESPFVVNVPVTDAVARYRIGFRAEDGRVIAHVDKRQNGPVAALRLGSGQGN